MKTGYLKKDRQERFNVKRAWYVDAWRPNEASNGPEKATRYYS